MTIFYMYNNSEVAETLFQGKLLFLLRIHINVIIILSLPFM